VVDRCLDGTLAQLLAAGRYEEALASQQHLDAVAQLAVQQNEYERAKENDELEEAIHIKKVVLPALRARLASDPAVEAWSRPVAPPYATAGTLAAEAVSRFGKAEAAPFARLCSADLSSVAASDLPAAAAKLRRLRAAHVLLMETSREEQRAHLEALDAMGEAILRTMTDAEALVSALPPSAGSAERAAALRSPKVRATMQALLEMRRLGCLVASSREWHASVFCTSAVAGAAASAAEAAAKLCAIYQRAAAVAAPDDEAPEPVDGDKYWAAPQPLSERCALSLLPLQSADAFPELPPTVAWEGKRCHAPCVNLWLHGVKQAWPAV